MVAKISRVGERFLLSQELSVSRILSAPSDCSEEAIIYLGHALPRGSSERPNLLFHRKGFTTSPCRHGTKHVADRITILHTSCYFSPFVLLCRTSIVSVALSLGFKSGIRE